MHNLIVIMDKEHRVPAEGDRLEFDLQKYIDKVYVDHELLPALSKYYYENSISSTFGNMGKEANIVLTGDNLDTMLTTRCWSIRKITVFILSDHTFRRPIYQHFMSITVLNPYVIDEHVEIHIGRFTVDVPRPSFDLAYIEALQQILREGTTKTSRSGNTVSVHGLSYNVDISRAFPILTLRKIFWRGAIEEMRWMMSGSTDSKELERKGIKYWKKHTSRTFLDNKGLTELPEGDLGPGYGFQMRHYGAKYTNCHTDYTDRGYDQLVSVITSLRENRYSRRHMVVNWNPPTIEETALPPCHFACQFLVRGVRTLDCILYQRSGDMMLGVPFNIIMYSYLTYYLASMCDLKPGKIFHTIGDAHIYSNHLEQAESLAERVPLDPPTLTISTTGTITGDSYTVSNYKHLPEMKLEMAV